MKGWNKIVVVFAVLFSSLFVQKPFGWSRRAQRSCQRQRISKSHQRQVVLRHKTQQIILNKGA